MIPDFEQYKHYNKEMEMAILGACLLVKDAITDIYGLVEPDHFYDPRNQFICRRLYQMWESSIGIDMLTVAQTCNHDEWAKIDKGGVAWYLVEMNRCVTSTVNMKTHALMVREMYANRKVIEIKMSAGKIGTNGVESLEDIKEQIDKVFKINTTDDWESIDQVLITKLINHMDMVKGRDILGIKTGFPSLDRMTAGFQGGQLIVIGARPSVGKSSFAGVIASTAAKQNKSVGIITLEMPNEQIGARLLSLESNIEFWRIWRNKMSDYQYQTVLNHMSDLSQQKIYFSDNSGVSVTGIKSKAEKLKKRHGLDMLIIDYLQLIGSDAGKGSTREREVAKMSLACKAMAMEMKIPVVLLAQLNRGSETNGGDKKPRLHNLRESGAIEQDADIVIMLHRDRVAEQELKLQGNDGPYDASLIIEKNRNGGCGEIPIKFADEMMLFFEEGVPLISVPIVHERTYRDHTEPNKEELDEENLF